MEKDTMGHHYRKKTCLSFVWCDQIHQGLFWTRFDIDNQEVEDNGCSQVSFN